MDKNTSLAFVLIGLILIVWLYFNSPTQVPKQQKSKADTTAVTKKDTLATKEPAQKQEQQKQTEAEVSPFGGTPLPEKIITIETDLARIELTTKGARIRRYFLNNYKTWYHNELDPKDTNYYNQHVQLVNTSKNGGDFNIIFVTKEGKLVNTSSLDFSTSSSNYIYKISGKDSLALNFVFAADNGKEIKKNFVFFGDNYASKVNIELDNMENVISSYRYDLVWQNGINFVEENSVDEARNSQAAVFSAD